MTINNDENCPPNNEGENDINNLSMSSVKAGAAVFGNLLFGSDTPDNSLCYSPSPMINRHNSNKNYNSSSNAILEESVGDGKALSFDSNSSSSSVESSSPTKKFKQKSAVPNKKKAVEVAPKMSAAKKTTGLREKEPKKKVLPHRKNPRSVNLSATTSFVTTQQHQSSVNPTINGVRRAKEENVKEKMLSVAELREQRRLEREEVAAFNIQAEQTRREVIDLRKKLNERFRQAKVDREHRQRAERLAKVENEIQFKSQVHVEHKRTLKQQEDTRRRMSTAARAMLRRNHREGMERMKLMSIQEDQALYEERYESSVAMTNTKADNAELRRESFAFRNGDARRIRELFSHREADVQNEEHESYELKRAGERDAHNYKKDMDQQRRESFAFRNAEGRRIRDLEHDINADAQHCEHESYELKWQGERDAEDYKHEMEQQRRDSFAYRNAEGRRIRDLEGDMKSDTQHYEHESCELKWAGERDAERYEKQMEGERRDSFALRNAEGRRIRDLESQMKSDAQQEEHESYELRFAGERDADQYKKQMDQQRRDSFAFRNAEGRRIRDLEYDVKSNAQQEEHESYELKWAGERDAEDYKLEMKHQRRDSFAFRNAEGKSIRDFEEEMKAEAQRNEHESYELKWTGERDAERYKKQVEEERRESFAFRNAEGRRIRDLESDMKSNVQQEQHESYELKWAGERDADNYKKEMAQERRDSLYFRNQEAARHDAVMRELMSLAQEREHESYMLKWAGGNDAKQYLAEMAQERRDSLAYRNAEGRRHREIDEEMRVQNVVERARDEELNAACEYSYDHMSCYCCINTY